MGHYPAPANATQDMLRAERLRAYAILDTPRENQFDRFVFTAAQMFRVPIAVLALIDTDRLWFKASVGIRLSELDRTMAFSDHLLPDAVLTVEDAQLDARFANLPIVTGEPYVRFYAGAPLVTPDGLFVGSISVLDRFPKTLLAKQVWQLSQLAQSIVTTLENRRSIDL
jgi:GAF domain-containing protein